MSAPKGSALEPTSSLGTGAVSLLGPAMASLAHGAGPAGGEPWKCTGSSGTSFHCEGPSAPLSATPSGRAGAVRGALSYPGIPNWYEQTVYMDNGSTGPPSVQSAAAYDPDLGEIVLFGGFDAPCAFYTCSSTYTWVYNGSGWSGHTMSP